MEEKLENNPTETVEEAPKNEVPEKEDFDYFNGINKVLTSLLAGIFGAGILFLISYFGAGLVDADLNDSSGLTVPFILIVVVAVFLSFFVSQTIQLYLYKLVEKDVYKDLGRKVFSNLISQLVLLLVAFPFVFVFFSKVDVLLVFLFVFYFMMSFAISASIREKGMNERVIGNMIGLFLAGLVFMAVVGAEDIGNPLITVIFIPLGMAIEALFDLFAEMAVYFVNKD